MHHTIWDCSTWRYLTDAEGSPRRFFSRATAELELERARGHRSLARFCILDEKLSIGYRLREEVTKDGDVYYIPSLIPIHGRVTFPCEWKLMLDTGQEAFAGAIVRDRDGEEMELVQWEAPGPHQKEGRLTCRSNGHIESFRAVSIFGANFRYSGPDTAEFAEARRWAGASKWAIPPRLTVITRR